MKCLVIIFIAIALIDQSIGYPQYNYGDVVVHAIEDMEPVVHAIEDMEPMRFKKSVYPGMCPCMKHAPAPAPVYHTASYSTMPCSKNLLSSCVPSVAPVPCSPPPAHYGEHKGAYSENYPQYAVLPTNEA